MELRAGYKQSEVGVIPEEWTTRPCSALSDLITVGIVVRPTQYYVTQGVPAFRSANIREHGIDAAELVFISDRSNVQLAKSQARAGDVLTVRTGYPGTSAVVPPTLAGSNCIDILITRPSKPLISSEYLAAWINSPFGKDQVLRNQGGLAQQHFNVGDLRNLVVALPPLPEQRAIAGALADVDALLGALTQLIAKKRDLKQAAMQQLLTRQTRLPGFDDEWETASFERVLRRVNAKANQIVTCEYQATGAFPVVDQGKEPVVGFSDRGDKRFRCPKGGVIIFGDHTCIVKFVDFDFVVGADGTQILATKPGHCARFHAFQLQLRGIPTTGYNRHFKFLKERWFVAPSLREQATIAAVLSDMDAELWAVEQRLAKTRALKQGMMQELLTGRIRLV